MVLSFADEKVICQEKIDCAKIRYKNVEYFNFVRVHKPFYL